MGRRHISSHQGSVLLLTLMVLLSLTIIETLAVSLTLLELRMTAYDSRIKQAQQAADAGLEATKASLVASMIAGKTPVQALSRAHPEWNGGSPIPWTISLGENQQARVDMPDLSRINTQGLIRIKSRGVYLNAAQSLQADLLYTNTAAYGLCTRELGISGHFMEIESLGTTEWLPRGVLQVTGSQMACKSEIPTAVPANCLHHIVDASGILVHSPPPTTAHLNDFMLGSSVKRDFIPPIIKAVQLKPCRKNAEQDSALWQIWTSSNFSAGNIHKPFHYVEGNLGETISLTVEDSEVSWFNDLCAHPPAISYPWGNWWQANNNYPRLVIISPASMEVTFSGSDFCHQGGYILLVSAGDITLHFQRAETQQARLIAISGQTIDLNSAVNSLQIEGSLNAASRINIRWAEEMDILQEAPRINLVFLPEALRSFPYPWSLLGLGTVTSYITGI